MTAVATLAKPVHGAECNSCGRCCIAQPCPLSEHVFNIQEGPCPALEAQADGRLLCGLVVNPQRYAPVRAAVVGRERLSTSAALLIGGGIGCDAQLPGEARNERFARRLKQISHGRGDLKYVKAIAAWWGA